MKEIYVSSHPFCHNKHSSRPPRLGQHRVEAVLWQILNIYFAVFLFCSLSLAEKFKFVVVVLNTKTFNVMVIVLILHLSSSWCFDGPSINPPETSDVLTPFFQLDFQAWSSGLGQPCASVLQYCQFHDCMKTNNPHNLFFQQQGLLRVSVAEPYLTFPCQTTRQCLGLWQPIHYLSGTGRLARYDIELDHRQTAQSTRHNTKTFS